MKLESLRDLSKDDILGALGLSTLPTPMEKWGGTLAWFGAGLAVGAVVALAFAPKTGRDLRHDMRNKFRSARNKASETVSHVMEKAERALSDEEGHGLT
jgi:hypothetical protein